MLVNQILTSAIHGKYKKSYKNNKLKHLHQRGMINLNFLRDQILHQIFKIIFSTSPKNMRRSLIIFQWEYM